MGLVLDGETGEPLPLAHVRLAHAAVVTDESGHFVLPTLPPGPHVLTASYIGYRGAAAHVTVASGITTRETLALHPAVLHAGAIVVDGLEGRAASEALGADLGHHAWGDPESAEGHAGASLSGSAPAGTSSVDGAALRPLVGVGGRTFRDGLSIQGGEVGEHALLLDGAKVYEPLAIGPALGAMSPLAVGRVTVHKAGFGARHGSRLAGVLDARHQLARPPNGVLGVAAEADAYAAGARLQQHAALGRLGREPVSATTMVAGRQSLWNLRRPNALDQSLRAWNEVDPVLAAALESGTAAPRPHYDAHRHGSDLAFSDLHAATRVRIGALHAVSASFYRGTAHVETEQFAIGAPHQTAGEMSGAATDPAAALLARDGTRWTNTAASLRADLFASARWRVGGGARYSHHTLRQRYDALDGADIGLSGEETPDVAEARLLAALGDAPRPDNGNDLREFALTLDAVRAFGNGHEVEVGAEASVLDSRFHLLSAGYGETVFRDLDADRAQTLAATYADARYRLGARWRLEPGLRLTARTSAGDVLAEPRLALRYDALAADHLGPLPLRGVSARVAAGVYRQFTSRVELATFGPSALVPDVAVWLPIDQTLDPASAFHLASEVLWQPTHGWSARVEGYAKAMPRVYALDYAALLGAGTETLADQADFLLAEEGRSFGIGARLERQAARWAARIGASAAQTERRSPARFGGRWTAAPWAEPLRATAGLDVMALGRRGGDGLLLRARALGVWGRSWALRRAYYDVLPARGTDALGTFRLDRPGSDRLAPLLTLDLGASYTHALGDGRRIELAVDVENALDRQNVLDWSLRPDADGGFEAVTRTLPGIQPSVRLRITL